MISIKNLRSLFHVFLLLGLLLLMGCFEYDEKIVMNVDGSGNLYIHYQAEQDMKFETLYFPTDVYDIEYNIKNNYVVDGVTNTASEVLQKEDQTHVYMDYHFKSLAALGSSPRFKNEQFSYSVKNHLVTLQRFLYLDESKIDRTKLFFKTGIKSFFNKEILQEIHFRFQWVVPGEIVDTNATILMDKNHAIWIMTLAEILKNRSNQFFVTYREKTAG
ncbi:MAG TPA: hypothetical protein ENH29_10065 [Bacteroidetes bacterium]|nr:hypothetical protein [Bacteroidota bacterium]